MGIVSSVLSQSLPPASKFDPGRDISDLTGRTVIVTGGYSGIGYATTKELIKKNARVYIAGRSPSKAQEAIDTLHQETGGKEALFLHLDLGDLKSIKAAAETFTSQEKELHILFNNGGVMMPAIANQLTSDGYDLHFGTNVLGHFYLTTLLLPALRAGAKSSPDGKARVVNLSSISAYVPSKIDFAVAKGTPLDTAPGKFRLFYLYAHSKFGNIVFSNELAKRYGHEGIVSTAVNPGNLKTPLYRHFNSLEQLIVNIGLYEPRFGALTQLWAGTSPETATYNGEFLVPWARLGKANNKAADEKMGEKLWEWMEQQVRSV